MSESIYDIPLKTWDNKENMLADYKGKVTLIINVTADCGNAPQFGVIESIYRKYKDQGFEVVAVPTNDYCGSGITYDEYECGITDAASAKEYAESLYDVSYKFSELITSQVGEPLSPEALEAKYPGRTQSFPRALEEGETVHELYQQLTAYNDHEPMYGNFEKFLVDKDGRVAKRFPNGTLLDFAKDSGDKTQSAGEDYLELCETIEALLEDRYVNDDLGPNGKPRYAYK